MTGPRIKFTLDDYMTTPPDKRYQLLDGELILAPSPTDRHQAIGGELFVALHQFVRQNDLGQIRYAPLDVVLSDYDVVQPDLLFVSNVRADIITETNIQGAPDLVVEILSPVSVQYDRGYKRTLYSRTGVREYWLVAPDAETIEVLIEGGHELVPYTTYHRGETLTSQVLPGLAIDLESISGNAPWGLARPDRSAKELEMEPFTKMTGIVAPMDRVNVDTDQIIPAMFLKSIARTGYGPNVFFSWRFDAEGRPNPDFVLNVPAYQGATIMVAGSNFGCGSSREHAPWALLEYGFRCLIAPSFADIFYNNCFQNGILPVTPPAETVRRILDKALADPGYRLNVDLDAQRIWDEAEEISFAFEIDPFRRHALLNGLDDIGITLEQEDKITAYEARRGL